MVSIASIKRSVPLLKGIFSKAKACISLPNAMSSSSEILKVPMSCFKRSKDGKFVYLYRGLESIFSSYPSKKSFCSSVYNAAGKSMKERLKQHNLPCTREGKLKLMGLFSSLTQAGDPILHATTSPTIAKGFTHGSGCVVQYKVPTSYVEKFGAVGSLGEDEIDFFGSIPQKFIDKITNVHPKPNPKQIGFNLLPQIPQSISIDI